MWFPVSLKVKVKAEPLAIRPPAVEPAPVQVWEAGTISSFKIKLKTFLLEKLIVSNSVIIRAKLMLTVRTGSSNLKHYQSGCRNIIH